MDLPLDVLCSLDSPRPVVHIAVSFLLPGELVLLDPDHRVKPHASKYWVFYEGAPLVTEGFQGLSEGFEGLPRKLTSKGKGLHIQRF